MHLIDAPELLAIAALVNSLAQLVSAWRGRSGPTLTPASPDSMRPGPAEVGRTPSCRRDQLQPLRVDERE
jgi:hypothetical protein